MHTLLTVTVVLQVDFSQSVHHLWKQYRRHGKAGGAEELAAANEQGEKEAGGPRGALPGGLKLKPGAGGVMSAPAGKSPAQTHRVSPHSSLLTVAKVPRGLPEVLQTNNC